MRADLKHIIKCLNNYRVRATYGAVGGYLNIHPVVIAQLLGRRRTEASWIVSVASGRPTGYPPEALHRDLFKHSFILTSADELCNLVENCLAVQEA